MLVLELAHCEGSGAEELRAIGLVSIRELEMVSGEGKEVGSLGDPLEPW